MSDSEYREKRDFRRTPEPKGSGQRRRSTAPIFVIQQHDARSMHFDFRVEADGVLKSWAVPKGPSTNPKDKRLAMPTEDHPMEYSDFEGVIPKGEYGAGPVIVWDRGTYENMTVDREGREIPVSEAIDDGELKLRLHGEKLIGTYVLVRTGGGGRERWLLIKERGEGADARRKPARTQPDSVLSGRTLKQVAAEEGEQ
ncbi:MAG TPA: DNA polymerase ligase N-terminal domain-containing protein [Solirubrobacterales bacterium]|nr:DNA polymerase ligase N-terminal domain-containing protein [Solirubrobacterales bacterium]